MLTVIDTLMTLNHTRSTSKQIISNAILWIDKVGAKNEIRVWPSFYPPRANFSFWNWYLSAAFVFPVCLWWGCGLNMVLISWSIWKLVVRIKFAAFGQKIVPCSMKQLSTVVLGAWCGGGDRGRRRVAKTFYASQGKTKREKWQLRSAWRIKCSNSEKLKL